MKKVYFLASLLVISVLAITMVSAFWPFTGRAVKDTSCKESDFGLDDSRAGIVAYQSMFGFKYVSDMCKKDELTEYYCDKGKIKNKKTNCKIGCSEEKVTFEEVTKIAGKCVKCVDSDGEKEEIYEKGFVTDDLGKKYQDKCEKDSLTEYICNKNSIDSLKIVCDYKCKNDACVKAPFVCNDSDTGRKPETAGVVSSLTEDSKKSALSYLEDTCSGKKEKITEFSCKKNSVQKSTIKCNNTCQTKSVIAFGRTFTAGYCDPQPNTCTEEGDNANDINNYGVVSVVDDKRNVTSYEDVCNSTNNLTEYYCEGNSMKSEIIKCPDVCLNGRCTLRTCIDSDRGKNFGVKGKVTTQYANISDFCIDNKKIAEFYCKSEFDLGVSLTTGICSSSCSNGICVGGEITSDSEEDII